MNGIIHYIHRPAMVVITALLLIGTTAGQSRTTSKPRPRPTPTPAPAKAPLPSKRPVTVNLKQGDQVEGFFLRADAETIEVEVRRVRLTFKMNEVASLIFTTEVAAITPLEKTPAETTPKENPPATDPQLPTARKAHAALRKLADAAQIGLPYAQYGSLLIEVKAAVEQSLLTLPEGTIKDELAEALEAYKDAGQAWGIFNNKGVILIATQPGAALMKKYSIKPSVNAIGDADHLQLDTTLSKIWTAAAARLDSLSLLLGQ